jgi:hypothetical protein
VGFGLRVQTLGFSVLGFKVYGLEFRVGFEVWG